MLNFHIDIPNYLSQMMIPLGLENVVAFGGIRLAAACEMR
jgi:hypothetical protein